MRATLPSLIADTGRISAGVLLLLAAGLKSLAPSQADVGGFALTDGPLRSPLLVAECLLAAALLGRLFGGLEVILATLAFAGFTTHNV